MSAILEKSAGTARAVCVAGIDAVRRAVTAIDLRKPAALK